MKIGVFYPNWSQTLGGGYTFQRDILEALKRSATDGLHEYYIFSPQEEEGALDQIMGDSLLKKVIYAQPRQSISVVRWCLRKMERLGIIRKTFYASVKESGIEAMWFLVPWHELLDVPYATVVWDLQHRLQPWFPELVENGTWEERESRYQSNLRRASFVLTGTQRGAEEIEKFYQVPRKNIRVLPLPTPFIEVPEPALPIQLPKEYLFYPAQFWAHKNHVALLHAIKILDQKHGIKLSLVLVGSNRGNEKHIKKLIHQLKLDEQVHMMGFVERDQLAHIYRNAVALVFPTFFGPDNLPPLEAFALGCPVVASSVPGSEEQLGDAALLVDPLSEEEIAGAVARLYKDANLREQLITKGKERAERWNSCNYVQAVAKIFSDFEKIRRCWK